MPRSIDQQIPQWEQVKDSTLNYAFNMRPWAEANGEVIDTITATVLDSATLISIGTQNTTNGKWVAPITANTVGDSIIELVGTTVSTNQTRRRRFTLQVTDVRLANRVDHRR